MWLSGKVPLGSIPVTKQTNKNNKERKADMCIAPEFSSKQVQSQSN